MYLHNVLKYNLFLIKTHFIYIETFINCVVVIIHYKSQNNTAQIHFNSIMMKYVQLYELLRTNNRYTYAKAVH